MCVNYVTVSLQLAFEYFRTPMEVGEDWREELYQDYVGPIIVHDDAGNRKRLTGTYGFTPKRRMPPGQRLTTMNARAETVGQLRTYKSAWAKAQLCLVPMRHFFEPNWEQEKHVRWSIGMASGEPFAVAGIYREWTEDDSTKSYSFTQLTINADEHPLMHRFHRQGEEKRSLVIVPSTDYDEWLGCKDPERARTYLQPYPAELMAGEPASKVAGGQADRTILSWS